MNIPKPTIAPGIYEKMPAEEYHAENGYIGSSPLPKARRSMAHFLEAWLGPAKPETAPQKTGSFFHGLNLEQDIAKYVARPLKDDGTLVRSNSKEYAAFLAANPGKVPVEPEFLADAEMALTAYVSNPEMMETHDKSLIECSIFVIDPVTGLPLKARLDKWGRGHSFLADQKTTTDCQTFDRYAFQQGLDLRLLHYAMVAEIATGEKVRDIYFEAVEIARPFANQRYQLTQQQMFEAVVEWRGIINEIAECVKNNSFPSSTTKTRMMVKPMGFLPEEPEFGEAM